MCLYKLRKKYLFLPRERERGEYKLIKGERQRQRDSERQTDIQRKRERE